MEDEAGDIAMPARTLERKIIYWGPGVKKGDK